jgi:hypothetical protein
MQRPQSAPSVASRSSQRTEKSLMDTMIDGDKGPKMSGVLTYPYSRSQRLYLDDFRCLVASSIDHPYMATTGFNVSSVPHDLLRGSNFDDAKLGGVEKTWRSECRRAYPVINPAWRNIVAAKTADSSGVRSEQFQFLG